MIAELAERSPIIIQNGSSYPSSRKNLDLRPYDRPYKVLLLTCVVNWTTGTPTPRLCPVVQWSVHWAPSRTTRVLVLAGARRCALGTCGKKKCELRFKAWLNLYSTSSVKTNRRADVIRFTVFVTLSRPYATGNVSIRLHLPRIYFKRFPLNKNSIFLNCMN